MQMHREEGGKVSEVDVVWFCFSRACFLDFLRVLRS
jgi:hypothetical protein